MRLDKDEVLHLRSLQAAYVGALAKSLETLPKDPTLTDMHEHGVSLLAKLNASTIGELG